MFTHHFWQRNLQIKIAHAQAFPFTYGSYHLLRLGFIVSPRLFSNIVKPKSAFTSFQEYSCFDIDDEILLCDANINKLLMEFWLNRYDNFNTKFIKIQLRIKSNTNYYSLSKIQTVSHADRDDLILHLNHELKSFYERYSQFPINRIFVRYAILHTDHNLKTVFKSEHIDASHLDKKTNLVLPPTWDLYKWGYVTKLNDFFYQVKIDNALYTVVVSNEIRTVSISTGSILSKSFKDTIINESKDEFVRELDNGMRIYYAGGLQTKLIHPEKLSVFMKPIKKEKTYKFSAITMDLETRQLPTSSGYELEVISLALFDGEGYLYYFITDFVSSEVMIKQAIKDIFNKYADRSIYIHNLSGFDGMFLLKYLAADSDRFNIVMKEDKIISLKVTKNRVLSNGKIMHNTLIFKDSLLLLPASLKSLAKGFGVTQKGDFDLNRSINATDQELYEIREDLLYYNRLDCYVLYQVLFSFSELIYEMFSININDIPTISSLALIIYRSNFMGNDARIPITDTKVYGKLKSAYFRRSQGSCGCIHTSICAGSTCVLLRY